MISVKLALVSIAALAALAAPAGAAAQVPESVEPTRFDLTVTADRLSLDEIGRLVPAIRDYTLPPGFRISSFVASGPLEELSMEFRVVSDRSSIDGNIVADVTAPRRAVNGVVEMDSFNLARLLERPSLPTSVTGRATIDLVFQEQGAATRIYGEYRVEGAEVSVEGLHATGVSAQGRLAGDRVHVDRASANLYGGAVTASGFATLPGRSQPLGYEFSGRARGVNLERLPARLRAPAVSTDLAFDYRVSSAGGGPEGQVKFERSRAAGAIVEPGTTARFSLAGEGPVSYSAEGRLSGADLRQIGRELGLEALQQPRFRGLINARFALEGRGATLGPVCATLTDSRLFGGTVPGMELRVSMDGEGLRFDAVGEFASIDPAVVLQSEDTLEAIFSGKLNVRGSVARIRDFDARDLVVEGEATLGEGRLRGIAVDAATVKGRYANRLVELEGLTVRGPDLALTASGDVALGEGAVSALDFTLRTPRLQALAEPFGVAAHGALETAGRLTGPVGELRLEGKLSASDLAYSAASAGKVSADYNVMVPSLDLARSEVGAEVRANRLALGGRHFDSLSVEGTLVERRARFDVRLEGEERVVEGRGALELHPDHQEVHLDRFALQLAGTTWSLPEGTPAAVQYGTDRIFVSNVRLVSGPAQEIFADGSLGAGAGPPLRVRATGVDLAAFDRLLTTTQKVTGRLDLDAQLSGPLRSPNAVGNWSVANGSVRGVKFESWTGEARYDGTVANVKTRLAADAASWLTVEGIVPVAALRGSPDGGREAAAPEWDLKVASSSIDLGLVLGFTSAISSAEGTIEVNATVAGPARDPLVNGGAVIRNGAFSIERLGTAYPSVDGRLAFDGNAVVVEYLSLEDAGGDPLLLAGRLPIRGGEGVSLQVQSEDFDVFDTDLGRIETDARLRFGGGLVSPIIRGQVRITNGEVNLDEALQLRDTTYRADAPQSKAVSLLKSGRQAIVGSEPVTGAAQPQVAGGTQMAGARPGSMTGAAPGQKTEIVGAEGPEGIMRNVPVDLDVQITVPDSLRLRGTDLRTGADRPIGFGDLNITLGGEVRAEKRPNEGLRLTGEIETVRGIYEFQGREFELVRGGSIRFTGQERLDPLLDISAQRLISGVRTQVNVGGTLSAPTLDLSSQPPLDQSDILSLIVFNVPVNQIGAAEQVSLSQRATALVGGFFASKLAETLGSALDLDLLDIETGARAGAPGATVTLGEQIGDLYVKFRQGVGPESVSEVLIEYRIRDWLRLQSSMAESRGVSRPTFRRVEQGGIDAVFFFSY